MMGILVDPHNDVGEGLGKGPQDRSDNVRARIVMSIGSEEEYEKGLNMRRADGSTDGTVDGTINGIHKRGLVGYIDGPGVGLGGVMGSYYGH